MTKSKATSRVRELTQIALCAALMAVGAWLTVPLPPPFVPFTMQTFAVFLTVGLLGMRNGTAAVLLYLLLGALGLPVFSGMRGGIGVLLGTTGGYLVGFIFSALTTGGLFRLFGVERGKETKKSALWMAFAMAAGFVVYSAFGTAWFMAVYAAKAETVGLWTALSLCVAPYFLPDCVKIALAVLVTRRLGKWVK